MSATVKGQNIQKAQHNQSTQNVKKTKHIEMSEDDKQANLMIINNMNRRINYLRNPRFKESKRPVMYSDLTQRQEMIQDVNNIDASFRASPSEIIFRDYIINQVYELELILVNVSSVLKRIKIMPPEKQEFAVTSIKYPTKENGFVAPGMAVTLKVQFYPSSFVEFDDSIAVLMEENIFRIPVKARKESLSITVPDVVDCKSCWIGDQICKYNIYEQNIKETKFQVKNHGGEAMFRFFKEDQDPPEEYLEVGAFVIMPIEFQLQKNEQQEVTVIFRPNRDGDLDQQITLSSDNATNTIIKLKGSGNTVELTIDGIDDNNNILTDIFSKVFFYGVPGQSCQRKLRIRNKTSVEVKYHWKIQNNTCCNISQQKGIFKTNELLEFIITLNSNSYYPMSEMVSLIIDDIPIQAIRNPSEQLIQAMKQSNLTQLAYFEFELIYLVQLGQVEIHPPFYYFSGALALHEIGKNQFEIKNLSKCIQQFVIRIDSTSSNQVQPWVPLQSGKIEPMESIKVQLGIICDSTGSDQKITYIIDFNYANSLSVELIAQCEGAKVRLSQPMINFGLIKSYQTSIFSLVASNQSGVAALCKLYSASKTHKLIIQHSILSIPPHSQVPIDIEFKAEQPEKFQDFLLIDVEGGETLVLETFAEVQSPSVSLNRLLIEIDCIYSGNIYTFDERAQYNIVLQNLGNIPTPFYWNVPESNKYIASFEPQKGILKPKTNLPIKFSVKPRQGGFLEELFICDVEGLDMPLGFEFKTNVLGLSVEYELIDDSPLLPLSSTKKDIVSQQSSSLSRKSSYFRTSFQSKIDPNKRTKSMIQIDDGDDLDNNALKTQKLEKINFLNCTISQPKQVKFLLRNKSGIQTQFVLKVCKYEAYRPDNLMDQKTQSVKFSDGEEKYKSSQTTKSIIRKTKNSKEGKPVVLLTDQLEKRKIFTSTAGQQLIQQKKLESDQRIYLSNNLGVAIVCEPQSGTLPAYGSIVVTVTAFNDICGLFTDELIAEVTGLDPIKFPVTIDIRGSPIIITPNQLGIAYQQETPTFDLGPYMRNSGLVSREFKVTNTGPKDIELEWKVYNLNDTKPPYFDIKIVEPQLGSGRLVDVQFIAREPEETPNGPFQIQPKNERIKGRREKSFTVIFQAGEVNNYSSIIVANPILLESPQQSSVGTVSLQLTSSTILPKIYLDKIKKEDSDHLIKFQYWSSGSNKREQKKLCLLNKENSGFVCSIETEGPFKLISTSTNSPQKYELQTQNPGEVQTTFNLVQNSNIEVLIAFQGPQPSNFEEWPMNYKVYKHGRLNIYFANGDQQHFNLEGVLLRPFLKLNTSGIDNVEGAQILDFGIVHINNKVVQQVFLSNLSQVPAQWKLNYIKYPMKKNLVEQTMTQMDKEDQLKIDDQSVFEFQMTEGILKGPSTMVHTLPHATALPGIITLKEIHQLGIEPLKILINFKPKKNILYKSKYKITVKDGPALEFILKGIGSYDEKIEK